MHREAIDPNAYFNVKCYFSGASHGNAPWNAIEKTDDMIQYVCLRMGMRRGTGGVLWMGVADDAVPNLETNKDIMRKFWAK